MPIYEYQREDGTRFELRQSFSEEPLTTDPETSQPVRRVLSAPTIIYRGTGFYSTSYRARPKEETAAESTWEGQRSPRMCEASGVPSDEQIQSQIEALEVEREGLRRKEEGTDPTREQDVARLEEIRVDLDRLWDLLRQRRALRSAGENPDLASERSAETVEKYWQ